MAKLKLISPAFKSKPKTFDLLPEEIDYIITLATEDLNKAESRLLFLEGVRSPETDIEILTLRSKVKRARSLLDKLDLKEVEVKRINRFD